MLLACAIIFSVSCGGLRGDPQVAPAPAYQALIQADRLSFALYQVATVLDGLSATHIKLNREGRIADVTSLEISTALLYVVEAIRVAVTELNNVGKAPNVRIADLDSAIRKLRELMLTRVEPMPNADARGELKAVVNPLDIFLSVIRLEVMPR
jgi:hypothetical protein